MSTRKEQLPEGPGQAVATDAIAPDTRGMNLYEADPALRDLLDLYLPEALRRHLEPHLQRLGALAGDDLDRWAHTADRHPPVLRPRDRFGRDIQAVDYHPAYHELERVAFGEFGLHAMSHRGGVLGWAQPFPAPAKHAFTYLFNEAEFGLGCPINVTDSAAHLVKRFGDAALRDYLLERMLTQDVTRLWQGAQFMTEKAGGSDVGANDSVAVHDGAAWRIHGDKWFCSNADAELATVLARPEGAPAGTRGLGLFVVPRELANGMPNRLRIVRLKDKLGTRSMASGEIVLEGAVAWPLGDLGRGFAQMTEMLNWSRLSNGVKSAALMRRASHDARVVLENRRAFGERLAEKPLARRQMLKIQLPAEQALSMWLFTADALERAEPADAEQDRSAATMADVARLATPLLKLRATRDARAVTADAMEMRGGCGYVEDFANPRLVRDAHLGSIWEGTSNIIALDAVQRAIARNACLGAYASTLRARLTEAEADGVPSDLLASVRDQLERAIDFAARVADAAEQEVAARQASSALYHAASAALMTWEGGRIHRRRGDARRLLLAQLVVEHRLAPRDPLAVGDPHREASIALALLGEASVSMKQVAALMPSV